MWPCEERFDDWQAYLIAVDDTEAATTLLDDAAILKRPRLNTSS